MIHSFRSALSCCVLGCTPLLLAGCSSGKSGATPQLGAVTFTNVSGQPNAQPLQLITEGESAYVMVSVANDPQALGANWSVYCGSALPPGTPLPPGQTQDQSCGSFTPVHTMSGPVPSYATSSNGYLALYTAPAAVPKQGVVTLYAASTSSPSVYSSVTLTVQGEYIGVLLAPAPPATLGPGVSVPVAAVVSNDPNNAGVTWSFECLQGNSPVSTDCGALSQTQTASGVSTTFTTADYTGGSIILTATSVSDPTRTATATIMPATPGS
jgi:hypothetical protein